MSKISERSWLCCYKLFLLNLKECDVSCSSNGIWKVKKQLDLMQHCNTKCNSISEILSNILWKSQNQIYYMTFSCCQSNAKQLDNWNKSLAKQVSRRAFKKRPVSNPNEFYSRLSLGTLSWLHGYSTKTMWFSHGWSKGVLC